MILTDKYGHLVSDTSLEELHRFASRLRLKYEGFQGHRFPHYFITSEKRLQLAKRYGAEVVHTRELVKRSIRKDYVGLFKPKWPVEEKCPEYIPEKNNPYPLCDNKKCEERFVCCISARMKECE